MSKTYLYLTTTPEALVASMLPAHEFGTYLATGTRKRSRGEAMYFSLRDDFASDFFDLSRVEKECVPHANGEPKHSLYLGIYRVLEHVPLSAINNLFLVTKDGRVLELTQAPVPTEYPGRFHLYDELCPVHPLVVSALNPPEFTRFITDPGKPLHLPRICFAEMQLGELAEGIQAKAPIDEKGQPLVHIYDCIMALEGKPGQTKTVDRTHHPAGWCRAFKNGFFVGDQTGMIYFPFPAKEELEREHHEWLRSAAV
jgi:hypothetical protein